MMSLKHKIAFLSMPVSAVFLRGLELVVNLRDVVPEELHAIVNVDLARCIIFLLASYDVADQLKLNCLEGVGWDLAYLLYKEVEH